MSRTCDGTPPLPGAGVDRGQSRERLHRSYGQISHTALMKWPRHATTCLQAGEFRMGQDVLQAVSQRRHFFRKKQLSQLWHQPALSLEVLQNAPQVT